MAYEFDINILTFLAIEYEQVHNNLFVLKNGNPSSICSIYDFWKPMHLLAISMLLESSKAGAELWRLENGPCQIPAMSRMAEQFNMNIRACMGVCTMK